MIFVFVLFFIHLLRENYAMLKVKDSIKKKDMAFVENLKEDLRRNNDDYADILHKKNSQTSDHIQQSFNSSHLNAITTKMLNTTLKDMEISKTGTTPQTSYKLHSLGIGITDPFNSFRRKHDKQDERIKMIDKIRKRVDDALLSKESKDDNNGEINPQRRKAVDPKTYLANNTELISVKNIAIIRSPWKDTNKTEQKISDKFPRNKIKLISKKNNELISVPVLTTLPRTTTNMNYKTTNQLQQKIKKKKLEKFKKFIEKNKGLLKEFISSKVAIQTPAVPVPINPILRKKKPENSNKFKELELQQVMREAVQGLKRKESLERMPRAELLDMAPAKGGHIHKKRLRGRLCHRHVLVPEGPKYSSGGRAYVPPHAGGRARAYNASAAPRLLLPRCCNCCRKSVLGCE